MTPGVITADLHGKSVCQAKTAVDALLRRAPRGTYRIRLIHGFHCGTALREALREEYAGHPRVLRMESSPDGGATELILREYTS
ncbi:MAG: Smr/MutS family protein [Oscillibacter sp.]|jgi:DNA-nicking Smr family endonuclease|nr:Smr/MutS family protein [Oscillibacter sp.]